MNPGENQSQSNRDGISAVMVTYHPDPGVIDNIRTILGQVDALVVVDNGSGGGAGSVIDEVTKLPGVHLIRNPANLGIAAALNVGIQYLLKTGCGWIGTFDQDSAVTDRYFRNLLAARDAFANPAVIGMVVPGTLAFGGRASPESSPSRTSFVQAAVSSGSLIRADVFGEIGFFEEDMFIDYVDTEFCLRLRAEGLKILCANGVVLRHELGAEQSRSILGVRLSFRVHTAWRYYYIMRNRLVLLRRHALAFPRWTARELLWLVLELGRMIVLESNRGANLRCASRGIWDGLLGRLGRHPDFPRNGS